MAKEESKENFEKRPLFLGRIIAAFIIATIIFIGAFLIGYLVSYSKYASVSNDQESIRYNLLSLELEKQILTSSCTSPNFYSYSDSLDKAGSDVGILEERFGKTDPRVLDQKKIYTMLEVQHFLLITDYSEKCNTKIPTILFFYSNNPTFSDEADKMGTILTSYKKSNKNTMIYSLDYDLDSNLIKDLKNKYNITMPNTVLLNEKIKFSSLNNINQLNNLINNSR